MVADQPIEASILAQLVERSPQQVEDLLAGLVASYEEDGRGLLFNEINTLPGFTPYSMFPSLWAATGLPYDELVAELVRLALERHEHRSPHRRQR